MKNVRKTVDKILNVCILVLFIAMFGVTTLNVIMRYIFNSPLSFAVEFGLNATKDGSDANFDALEGAGLEVVDTDVDSLKAKINYNAYACAKTDVGKQILTSMGVAL